MALFSGPMAPGPRWACSLQVPFSVCVKHKLALICHLDFDLQSGAFLRVAEAQLTPSFGAPTWVPKYLEKRWPQLVPARANPCTSFLYVLFYIILPASRLGLKDPQDAPGGQWGSWHPGPMPRGVTGVRLPEFPRRFQFDAAFFTSLAKWWRGVFVRC